MTFDTVTQPVKEKKNVDKSFTPSFIRDIYFQCVHFNEKKNCIISQFVLIKLHFSFRINMKFSVRPFVFLSRLYYSTFEFTIYEYGHFSILILFLYKHSCNYQIRSVFETPKNSEQQKLNEKEKDDFGFGLFKILKLENGLMAKMI